MGGFHKGVPKLRIWGLLAEVVLWYPSKFPEKRKQEHPPTEIPLRVACKSISLATLLKLHTVRVIPL